MREAEVLFAVGITVGGALAPLASRVAASLLYGLKPRDPATLVMSVIILAIVAAAASFLPAPRASKVDPMMALRYE